MKNKKQDKPCQLFGRKVIFCDKKEFDKEGGKLESLKFMRTFEAITLIMELKKALKNDEEITKK